MSVHQKCFPFLFFLASAQLWAQSATTTTLSVSAATVTWPAPVTLTATVKAGANPVTPGLVKFCNANAATCQGPGLLGQAQLQSNGMAVLKLALAIGTHSLKAEFGGTKTDGASSSTAETVTITGVRPSSTALTASAKSPYTLTATVSGTSSLAVSGNVSFVDTSNANAVLGTAALGTGVTAQGFAQQIGTGAGSEPVPLVVGDFNGDGYPDVVVGDINASGGTSTLMVYLSNGNGTYAPPATITLSLYPLGISALAAGDFNKDGKLDLAVASGNANSVAILLGNGGGGFTLYTQLPTGTDPNSIAVGDFNGDGNADLAITNQFSSSVTIALGDGQGGFVEMANSPATDSFPYSVAVGDFNGDGKQDLAVANYFGNDVTVLLGNGDGTFSAAASPNVGVYPDWVAVGDFNGDGKQDLAVVNQFSRTVTILLGNGMGGFTATSQSPATGNNPDSVAIADFNGDGIEDLAVATSNDNTVTILFGKGDGTFPAIQTVPLPAGTAPYSAAAADFNADGMEDFAVAGSGNNTAVIALNTVTTTASATLSGVTLRGGGSQNVIASFPGSSNYAASISGAVPLSGTPIATSLALTAEPASVGVGETVQLTAVLSPAVVGALNATGSITFSNGTSTIATVLVSPNSVSGGAVVYNYTLTAAGTQSIAAKYSGDSNFLASVSGTVNVTAVASAATTTTLSVSSTSVTKGTVVSFTATVASGGTPVKQGSVTFCNANATFCEDAAVLGRAQLTANGTGTISQALPFGLNVIKAVFSGAAQFGGSVSAQKIVTVNAASTLATTTALTVTGTPGNYTFTATVKGSWPPPTGTVSFVDTSNKNLTLHTSSLSPGVPSFPQSAALATGNNPETIAVADFNGDGKPDLAVSNYYANTVTIYLGNGAGTFTAVASPFSGTPNFNSPLRVVAGDFNADGKPDLAVVNTGSNNLTILLGTGNGTFAVKSAPATGSTPESVAVGDFNGDGKLDLAVANYGSTNLTILLGNGDGTFTADPVLAPTQAGPSAVVTADFNHDGKADLAVANTFSANVTILLGNGDGTFSAVATIPVGDDPIALAVGDFNHDGSPDLAVVNFGDFDVTILLNTGTGTLKPVTIIPTGTNPQGIVAGDFNGDGLTDLAITNATDTSLTLLLGNGVGQFSVQTVPLTAGSGPIPIALGDFNLDGSPDLAVGDVNSNTVHILLNSATSIAQASGVSVTGSGTHEIEAIYAGAAPYLGSTSTAVAVTGTP